MAKELRFVDPAFRCEVIISGPAKALYEIALPQFERLKEIKSLGILAHINDIAVHRHQHLIGLMRIFNKLCQQEQGKGLPRRFLWSFWCRLCFSQVGHAALSYDSEKAVLLSCHLDSSFKAGFRSLIEPVFNRIASCSICDKACEGRDKGPSVASSWFDDLIAKNRWRKVHLWVAALKLIQEPKIINILTGQAYDGGKTPGFSEIEAMKMLICPECLWNFSIENLNRLDYLVRDLAFAGTLGIQLDVDNLVSAANEDHPDWQLLDGLNSYLSDILYESLRAQTASVLYQRSLASFLISKKISLEELFGIDLTKKLDDETLIERVAKVSTGREVFGSEIREAWHAWKINTYIDDQVIPCEIEKKITKQTKLHLSRHVASRVTCLKLAKNHHLALAMCHRGQADRPEARAFIKLCRSLLMKQYPRLNAEHLMDALYEGFVDRTCEVGLPATVKRLAKLDIQIGTLRGAAEIVNKHATKGPVISTDVSIKIGDFDYPIRGDPQALIINTMHAALMGNDQVRKNLGTSIEDAAEILWYQLLEWQTIYFGQRPAKKILGLVDATQSKLALSVVGSASTAETDLEIYTLLEALKHPSASISFRIALPNLKLVNEDGKTENEYDVVSVVLIKDKDVEVWIWGATTQSDIAKKRNEDLNKIQKLKDLLGNRWGNDVRIATCYIHKDGNDICCEIDGRQERRQING
jgi:hypothetical protein